MLFKQALLALLVSSTTVLALPGGGDDYDHNKDKCVTKYETKYVTSTKTYCDTKTKSYPVCTTTTKYETQTYTTPVVSSSIKEEKVCKTKWYGDHWDY